MSQRIPLFIVLTLAVSQVTAATPAISESGEAWSTMTAAKFKSLPDLARIRLKDGVATKAEILALFNRARANVSRAPSGQGVDLAALRTRAAQTRKAAIAAQNASFLAGHQQEMASGRAGSAQVVPSIAKVEGTAQHDAMLWIKGSGFGSKVGHIYLKGNFPGGQLELQEMNWSPTSLLGHISLPQGGAPAQGNARLVVVTYEGKVSNEMGNITFVPEIDYTTYLSKGGKFTCSQNGVSNYCGHDLPDEMYFGHIAFPDGSTFSGQDRFDFNLKNGWTLQEALKTCSYPVKSNMTLNVTQNGSDSMTVNWSIATTYSDVVTMQTLQSTENFFWYSTCNNLIAGPKGMPWQ